MQKLILLRILVTLRLISKNQQEANVIARERLVLEKERLALEHKEWQHSPGILPTAARRTAKLTDISHPTVDEWNTKHRESGYDEETRP